jgi:hypothetical protein
MMTKRLNYILMADIIGSRKTNQQKLMKDFKNTAGKVDHELRDQFLSPITITLGDEFQSIPRDLPSALNIILRLEEAIIKAKKGFRLRYVLVEGLIETPINSKTGYEMLGSGLTRARELASKLSCRMRPWDARLLIPLSRFKALLTTGNWKRIIILLQNSCNMQIIKKWRLP